MPLIVSPVDSIDLIWPASSWLRKYGLNGTFTRGSDDGWKISTDSQLIARMIATKIQKPIQRWGGRGLC